MPTTRQKGIGAGIVIVIVAVIAALASGSLGRVPRLLRPYGSGCTVGNAHFVLDLTTGQAAIAATIAGVARRQVMPERAVTIAYAAALQESDLENLPSGDRDSVGVFQQRPSQGWGSARKLHDPVYASSRFFTALAAVPGYQHLRIYQAAQDVQHSADGYAYSQYAGMGKAMAGPFTGGTPHAVWCWYGDPARGGRQLTAAARQLTRTFGPLDLSGRGRADLAVRTRGQPGGWAVASWLVTHADSYGIRTVSYLGYRWEAASGRRGWVPERTRRPRGTQATRPAATVTAGRAAVIFG